MSFAIIYRPRDVFGIDIALRQGLMVRDPDWDHHEDGLALSSKIWRWHGHVDLHEDDVMRDELIIGFVYTTDGHKLVHGDNAFDLTPGTIYIIDPMTAHGAICRSPSSTLCCYIDTIQYSERGSVAKNAFTMKAIEAAWKLIKSPAPHSELI